MCGRFAPSEPNSTQPLARSHLTFRKERRAHVCSLLIHAHTVAALFHNVPPRSALRPINPPCSRPVAIGVETTIIGFLITPPHGAYTTRHSETASLSNHLNSMRANRRGIASLDTPREFAIARRFIAEASRLNPIRLTDVTTDRDLIPVARLANYRGIQRKRDPSTRSPWTLSRLLILETEVAVIE